MCWLELQKDFPVFCKRSGSPRTVSIGAAAVHENRPGQLPKLTRLFTHRQYWGRCRRSRGKPNAFGYLMGFITAYAINCPVLHLNNAVPDCGLVFAMVVSNATLGRIPSCPLMNIEITITSRDLENIQSSNHNSSLCRCKRFNNAITRSPQYNAELHGV
ncbi:hypothetical protein EVAR_39261_1 [Eumeta japonica]|uniref:Uncharacterized protein n=1 Tax=Eumeta variegata TaxID=151549 RepID=A0A4C1Y3D2_EUMVA|nr:hypothetical protein EVAR_39261_1 [Eumeta japonica]